MKEIILSYGLLFADDRRSRILYKKEERARAAISFANGTDHLLDQFCGLNLSTSIFSFGQPVRETYNADTDFPIFAGRLLAIQGYMSGIEPSRIQSLWRDRRDLRLWYTIWAVIIMGGIGIIQSTVQIILSAAQVGLATESNQLQTQPLSKIPGSWREHAI